VADHGDATQAEQDRAARALGLELRAGGGARYQLAVFPVQRKVQLRKLLADGTTKYLDIAKDVAGVRGVGQANQLRLSAINVTSGPDRGLAQLRAYVGGTLVAEAVDAGSGDLSGRASGVSVGATANAKGAMASVDDIDLVAGRLAAVLALLGAEGSFGVKSSADSLLPDLLAPDRR